jgi:hypothetical protein
VLQKYPWIGSLPGLVSGRDRRFWRRNGSELLQQAERIDELPVFGDHATSEAAGDQVVQIEVEIGACAAAHRNELLITLRPTKFRTTR